MREMLGAGAKESLAGARSLNLEIPPQAWTIYPCDLCGSDRAASIPGTRRFTKGEPLSVCLDCSLVYVRRRAKRQLVDGYLKDGYYETGFYASTKHHRANLVRACSFVDARIPLAGRRILDVGAGEGEFLEEVRRRGGLPFGVEPSPTRAADLRARGIEAFAGLIEEYHATGIRKAFDGVSLLWTLEVTDSPTTILRMSADLLAPGGVVLVQTGNRILLARFPKPLQRYLGPGADTLHPYRFTEETLTDFLRKAGFEPIAWDRADPTVLTVVACHTGISAPPPRHPGRWRDVRRYFIHWQIYSAAWRIGSGMKGWLRTRPPAGNPAKDGRPEGGC